MASITSNPFPVTLETFEASTQVSFHFINTIPSCLDNISSLLSSPSLLPDPAHCLLVLKLGYELPESRMDASGNEGILLVFRSISSPPSCHLWNPRYQLLQDKSALLNTGSGSCSSFVGPISILNSTISWLLQSRVPTLLHLQFSYFWGTADSAVHHP